MNVTIGTCDVCGCRGLHACMGWRPKPMTDEERERDRMALRNACEIIVQDEEIHRLKEGIERLKRPVSEKEVVIAKQAFVKADPYFSPSGKAVRAMLEAFVAARSSESGV